MTTTWGSPTAGGLEDLERLVEDDLRRNVAEDCVILMNRGTFRGHQGVLELAQMLGARRHRPGYRRATGRSTSKVDVAGPA